MWNLRDYFSLFFSLDKDLCECDTFNSRTTKVRFKHKSLVRLSMQSPFDDCNEKKNTKPLFFFKTHFNILSCFINLWTLNKSPENQLPKIIFLLSIFFPQQANFVKYFKFEKSSTCKTKWHQQLKLLRKDRNLVSRWVNPI